MSASILVVTPHAAFGELVRLSLEEGGRQGLRLVLSGKEALVAAQRTPYALAILDCDLSDLPVATLAHELQEILPGIHLMVIPPDNDAGHPSLSGLAFEGILTRPFYAPDLLAMVNDLLDQPEPAPESAPGEGEEDVAPSWVQDTGQAIESLQHLMQAAAAQVVVISRGGKVWAYAGTQDITIAQELAALVGRYWKRSEMGDMVRFARLASDSSEHLLYATTLVHRLLLVLAFDPSLPLSQARLQALRMANALNSEPPQPLIAGAQPMPLPEPIELPVIAEVPVEAAPPAEEVAAAGNGLIIEPEFDPELPNEEEQVQEINLATLLAGMPSPDPLEDEPPSEWQSAPTDWSFARPLPTDPDSAPAVEHLAGLSVDTEPVGLRKAGTGRTPPMAPAAVLPPDPRPTEDADLLTRPGKASNFDRVSPALALVCYTCILIPRLPSQLLMGELAGVLEQSLAQTCLSFGWQLDQTLIRPEFVQWRVKVAPGVSPGYLVRVVRQRTSQQIFEQLAGLKVAHPAGDFWAPGYLVISGAQQPVNQVLRDFIQQTRRRQGLKTT